jgi:hypothetical protein
MEVMSTEPKVIHLTEERFAELSQVAAAQSKSPDELADEAIALLLRKRRLEDLMQFGQRHALSLGVPEGDVERLISETRSERRSRTR